MLRRAVFVILTLVPMLIPTGASAVGVWDPNDVRGPYDLRSVAAIQVAGHTKLTVTFYAGFEPSKLPRDGFKPGVWITDDYFMGSFFRNSNGVVKFALGASGGFCCDVRRVRRPSSLTLVTRYRLPLGDEGAPGFLIQGHSLWNLADRRYDWTRIFKLGA